jgi:hypothetical protein
VYVDGVSYSGIDFSYVPQNVHALQFNNGEGWIEFKGRVENEPINILPDWANQAVLGWEEAKVKSLVVEAPLDAIQVSESLIVN